MIHSTAIISDKAIIGNNVEIGAYSIIGDNVKIADNVKIMSHVCVEGDTYIGEGTQIFPFAAIGFRPQDLKFHGEKSKVIIGKNNSIREYVTVHPGTEGGTMQTVIGDNNLLMIGVHVAHDCIIGNNTVLANNVTLAGHVEIGDQAIIGGLSAVHQFVRIGHNAIIGGMTGVERDVIPFGAVKGERGHLYDVNILGLKRANFSREEILAIREAYEIIFLGDDVILENLNKAEKKLSNFESVKEIVSFMRYKSNRSYCLPKGK